MTGNQFSKLDITLDLLEKLISTHHTYKPTGTPECHWSLKNYSKDWFGPYIGFQHVETMVLGHYANVKPPLILCITKDGFLKMVWAMKKLSNGKLD